MPKCEIIIQCIQLENHCKNQQLSKSSKVKLTFIGCSGPNHSEFYLYRATSAALSATLSHAHAQA